MTELVVRVAMAATRARARMIALAALIGLVCLPMAILLYANLRSAIEELLPRNAPSMRALDTLHARLGDNLQLTLLVTGAPNDQLHRVADCLAAKVTALGPRASRFIDYRPGEVQEFFRYRKALFVELADMVEAERRLQARIDFEVQKENPLALGLDDEPSPAPEVRFDDIAKKYEGQASQIQGFPSGYYDGEDGRSLVMVFYPAQSVTGYEPGVAFRDTIAALAHEAAAEQNVPARFEFTGDIESIIQEQRSLQNDLLTSTVIVLLTEALVLFVFFRWLPALLVLGLPLSVGTLATFAASYVAIGSVNASTAFLGSIIVGNGINSGIMLLARFIEERRSGMGTSEAMQVAVRGTVAATAVAASAAALAYGSLLVTTFRGYSHFGFMGGLGMVLCWITTYVFVPPTACALDARWPVVRRSASKTHPWERVFTAVGLFAVRRWIPVMVLSLIGSAAVTVAVVRFARDPFEYDTTTMRSRWATEPGGYLEVDGRTDSILKRVITPIVVLVDSDDQARIVAQSYQTLIDSHPPNLVLGNVFTMQSLVAPQQQEKIDVLKRVKHMLRGSRLDRLDARTRDRVKEWLPAADMVPYAAADLPESLRRQFREKGGAEGKLVLLFPKHGANTVDGRVVVRLAEQARSIQLPSGAVVAGSYLVFADMLASIAHDGPLATVMAFGTVIVLSLWLARRALNAMAVTGSLVVGVLWTAGVAALGGMRINFLNFIALPITFGIGLDYAANVYGRYRLGTQDGKQLAIAVGRSGGAVAMCSATTVIGYASLLLSRNGALFSFGLLAVVGEIACLLSAIVLLPAMLTRLSRGSRG